MEKVLKTRNLVWLFMLLALPFTLTAQIKTTLDLQIGPKWELNKMNPSSGLIDPGPFANPFIIGGTITQGLPLNLEVYTGLTGFTFYEVFQYQEEPAFIGGSGPEVWSVPLGLRYQIKIPGINLEILPFTSLNFRFALSEDGIGTYVYTEGPDTTSVTFETSTTPNSDFTLAIEPGLLINYTFKSGIRLGFQSSIVLGLNPFTEGNMTILLPNGTTQAFTTESRGSLIKAQLSVGYELSRIWKPG